MTPEEVVRERIVAISTIAGSRVWMLKLPQKPTLPAVRVQRIGTVRDQHMRGPDGHQVTRVQVDLYAADVGDAYDTVDGLAAAIRGDGLGDEASGVWGWTASIGSPAFRIMNIELAHDGTPEYEAGELRVLRIRQDYLVHWAEM